MPRAFYRIVRANPPTVADFATDEDQGKAAYDEPDEIRRLRSGRSVYATEAQAWRRLRGAPLLGRYIAELELHDDDPVRWERTLSSPGHHTLWGDAALLLTRVVRTIAFEEEKA